MRNGTWCVLTSVLVVSLAAGCANQTRTVRTERTVQYPVGAGERSPEQVVVVEKDTRTEIRRQPQGILSTTIHVVGEILALPFRLVGGLLRLVF